MPSALFKAACDSSVCLGVELLVPFLYAYATGYDVDLSMYSFSGAIIARWLSIVGGMTIINSLRKEEKNSMLRNAVTTCSDLTVLYTRNQCKITFNPF